MLNTRRHNPILLSRLNTFSASRDWEGMLDHLRRLSVADFRTAGLLLADDVLPTLTPDDYWACFGTIVPTNGKAFLITFLKAAIRNGACHQTDNAILKDYLQTCATPIDKRKILETLLPHLANSTDALTLLQLCAGEGAKERIDFLIKVCSPISCYLLFREAQRLEDDPSILRSYCLLLMKRGDKLSFNLACILQQYFGLSNLPGTFSLRLKPYELSRLNKSFESFKSVLMK